MDNKTLANLMYPDIKNGINYYEEKYPKRDLPDGAVVSRFAPSPTGDVHMGSLFASTIESFVPHQTGGVFFLRIEDTDKKREIPGCVEGIIRDLHAFGIYPDEGVIAVGEESGEYGPYTQSERIEIYHTYAKWLVENDFAYPAFDTEEELDIMRKNQEARKIRIGYYGTFAKYRDVSNDEKAKLIEEGKPWVLRLKSRGNFEKKCVVNDLVRGKIEFPENDIDSVLIKENGIPVYHFAHVIDDHLMRTTHVLRGEEWLPSAPLHIELFKVFGFDIPKFGHTSVITKIDEKSGNRRKLSKRYDPEARVSYYHEMGIPIDAIRKYLLTLANSNFEAWLDQNPDTDIYEFKFDFTKMSASGSLFDIEKLNNISRNHIARMKAIDVYEESLKYYEEFDKDFYDLLVKYKDFSINVLNIEREQKKPRKDFACFKDIKPGIWYMYKELFEPDTYAWGTINDKDMINNILDNYINNYYHEEDDKETWFNRIKELTDSLDGFTSNMKEYKESPDNFKGNVADVSTVLRVALTSKDQTPDLYEIMRLLGKTEIIRRIEKLK